MKYFKFVPLLLFLLFPLHLYSQDKNEFSLEEIISIGLRSNPTLSAKHREVEAKKAAYQATKRLFNPELEFHTGRAKSYDGLEKRNTKGLSIIQPLENPFKRHHRIQMNKHGWQATEYDYEFLHLQFMYEIKVQFFKILMLKNNEELTRKNLQSIQQIHGLIEKRARLGEVKQLEAIKLYVETLKAEKELNTIQTEKRLAKDQLNKLLGNSLPVNFILTGEFNYSPRSLQDRTLLQRALDSHPLVKQKVSKIEQAKSYLSYMKWHRFPDFKLKGFTEEDLDGKNQGIGITFDVPLWNFKSKEIAEAENLSFKQREEFKALQIELTTEIKAKLSRVRLSEETIQIFITGLLKQAEESLKLSEVSYREGEISLIDFLDSQRTYYSILKDYHQALFSWSDDKAALEKALGETLK
jgi:cobalt-zinc-cadmium efflux system outer membrane protein